jgi:PAS domain S-box-containing protein
MRAPEKLPPNRIDPRTIPEAIRHEALLGGLFARVPEAIVLLDTDDHILQVNPQFTTIFGYTQQEACGRLINELVVPEELSAEADEYTRRGLRGESLNVETVRKHKDGTRVHVSIISGPVSVSGSQISEYVIYRDITERKCAEQRLRESEAYLAEAQRLSRTGSWAWNLETGDVRYWSEECFRVLGFDPGRSLPKFEEFLTRVHPEDRVFVKERFEQAVREKTDFELQYRLVHPAAGIRDIRAIGHAVFGRSAELVEFVGTVLDVTERKGAEEALQKSERNLAAIINTIPTTAWTTRPDGYCDFLNQGWLDYAGMTAEQAQGWGWAEAIHPEDRKKLVEEWRSCLASGTPVDTEARIRRSSDASYRWFLIRANPLRNESGNIIRWYGTCTDIEDRKRGEEDLRARELSWRQIVDNIPGLVATMGAMGEVEFLNRQTLEYFGKTNEELKNWALTDAIHPDDLPRIIEARVKSIEEGHIYEVEHRCRRVDGVYRWFQVRGFPVRNPENKISAWYLLLTDIDDRKHAEEKLRQSEQELRTVTDTIRQPIVVLAPDGTTLYANRVALDITGLTIDDVKSEGFSVRAFHPDDLNRLRDERRAGLLEGVPFDLQMRALLKDGQYRWHLIQYNPLRDEHGQIIRWYVTATNIDEQKRTEERLRIENLVLREEIDRSSMFEEIVGSSKPIHQLLKKVEKVAPSDSTVLILGETGTGKELIARALHRRSKRANRAFVKVNCAAIPQSLIASELFGHEKGAFTGALQRRLGRFEAANGGTLFLDEIGELPMETQIALLRVLQEREFERVGSNHPISVDVRVIAATNRDLRAAVADGTFRQDLFFRLNVFPVAVPSLRERVDDIPLLVEYFVGRFAEESGKTIRQISKDTLEQLKGYDWPGNIRELQNVIERAVILCETDTFLVDESWLERESAESSQDEGLSALADREVEMIQAALAETHGRISGPSGAAAKLGIPRQTLESKIRRLGIDKYGQKRPTST